MLNLFAQNGDMTAVASISTEVAVSRPPHKRSAKNPQDFGASSGEATQAPALQPHGRTAGREQRRAQPAEEVRQPDESPAVLGRLKGLYRYECLRPEAAPMDGALL